MSSGFSKSSKSSRCNRSSRSSECSKHSKYSKHSKCSTYGKYRKHSEYSGTLYEQYEERSSQSEVVAPDGQVSQVEVSSGRASRTAHASVPPSEALSGSRSAEEHCGVTHRSELAPAHSVATGKHRLKTSWVR